MEHKSYQTTIATNISGDNGAVAIAVAAQSLKRIHDSLDGRKFTANIMDVYVYGDGERTQYAVAFDVMYDCGDGSYFEEIQRRLDLAPGVEDLQEVHYEPIL